MAYVSPIDRMAAIAGAAQSIDQSNAYRDQMPLQQRLAQLRVSGAEGELHSMQQRQGMLDKQLQETDLGARAYSLAQMDDATLMQELPRQMPQFYEAGKFEGATPDQYRQRLGGIANYAASKGYIQIPQQAKEPVGTTDMREYEYAKSQGYQGTFQDWKQTGGKSPEKAAIPTELGVPFDQLTSDAKNYLLYNKLSPEEQKLWDQSQRGQELSPDEQVRLKAELAKAEVLAKAEAEGQVASTQKRAEYVRKMGDFDSKIAQMEDIYLSTDSTNTGLAQAVFKWFPGMPQYNRERSIESIESSIALEQMMALKRESPTGATGFGQLSEKELGVLQNHIANLASSQDAEAFKKNLGTVIDSYKRMRGLLKIEYTGLDKSNPDAMYQQIKAAGLSDGDAKRIFEAEKMKLPEGSAASDIPSPDSVTADDGWSVISIE